MSTLSYQDQALGWQPDNKADRLFTIIAISVVVIFIAFAIIASSITLPEPQRDAKTEVPERIAEFILAKEKPKPKPQPKPEPKPQPEPIIDELPEPEPEPEPQVKIKPKKLERAEPITEAQLQAREKAQQSGLLALSNELSDLIDTTSVAEVAGGKIKQPSGPTTAAVVNTDVLNVENGARTTAKVDSRTYSAAVSTTQLSAQERLQVSQSLVAEPVGGAEANEQADANEGSAAGSARSQEDVYYYFEQNKGNLNAVYRQARRSTPGLQGKIVFEITILPSGEVSEVVIKSSELNNPKLEARLLSRIKSINFGAKEGGAITVIYPVEFLPH
jgi:outer membrane biosynthesis protein TonB